MALLLPLGIIAAGGIIAAAWRVGERRGRHLLVLLELLLLLWILCSSADKERLPSTLPSTHARVLLWLCFILPLESLAHVVAPLPYLSVCFALFLSVVFTIAPIAPIAHQSPLGVRPMQKSQIQSLVERLPLQMGTVPPLCCLWLRLTGVLQNGDLIRGLRGNEELRPYHLVVMFLGSVYLCTALERSGFLHALACRVVSRFSGSPWGLFWALGCFSATLTLLIPDDIVTMTLTPVTIRMCQLLTLPELPFLFSQFFAGNIWAVTLVTGNPTNVLLAEDLGDTFLSFAQRMGIPGIAAGLVSFVLMWLTNRETVNAACATARRQRFLDRKLGGDAGAALRSPAYSEEADGRRPGGESDDDGAEAARAGRSGKAFTRLGTFCALRLLLSALFCALDSVHGLPVYLCVLIIGALSLLADALINLGFAYEVLVHIPWELLSFVTAFLVLAEAMATTLQALQLQFPT